MNANDPKSYSCPCTVIGFPCTSLNIVVVAWVLSGAGVINPFISIIPSAIFPENIPPLMAAAILL